MNNGLIIRIDGLDVSVTNTDGETLVSPVTLTNSKEFELTIPTEKQVTPDMVDRDPPDLGVPDTTDEQPQFEGQIIVKGDYNHPRRDEDHRNAWDLLKSMLKS